MHYNVVQLRITSIHSSPVFDQLGLHFDYSLLLQSSVTLDLLLHDCRLTLEAIPKSLEVLDLVYCNSSRTSGLLTIIDELKLLPHFRTRLLFNTR